MTDSLFLEEVVGFLHNMDDPAVTGSELLQSLDKNDALLSLPGSTEIALQLLDVTPIDDLFASNNQDMHTDSDCTSVECESVASSSSPVKDEVVDVRSRDAIRRSTYRQKQKTHRDELYKQVEELSLQLTTLQQQKDTEKARQGMGLSHTTVWKALANRHLQARAIAEEQRRRLLLAVEKRSKLIQDLGLLVRKRLSEEHPEGGAGFPTKKPRTESPDMALYEVYIKELDEIYAQTDKMFQDTRMDLYDDDVQGYYNPPPRRVVKDSSYHELVGKLSTPFNYEHVRSHIGRVCCMENRPGCEKVEGPWVPANTTVTKSRIPSGVAGGSLVLHAITRRYNEANRIVVIWRKFVEGEGVFAGMHSDETGWSIVRPSPAEGCVGTVLESMIRFVPINFSSAASSGATVRQFTDATIKAGEDDCRACIKKLEEMLLDEALGVC
ncbi:hypothetical protein PRIC1_012460 [Phytophthora ramorum]